MLYARILKSEIEKKSNEEIQFYLAIDNNSNRFYVGKKSDTEIFCIDEKSKDLKIIPNGPQSGLRLIGECTNSENKIANEIKNNNP